MLHLSVTNNKQNDHYDHPAGVLEIGRASLADSQAPQRVMVNDSYVSRQQLRIEERPDGRLWLLNLSRRQVVRFKPTGPYAGDTEAPLQPGQEREIALPVNMRIGITDIAVWNQDQEALDEQSLSVVDAVDLRQVNDAMQQSLLDLGEVPPPERLTEWLETIINLDRFGADLEGFYAKAARSLVELIGLDLGMVILRGGGEWTVAARHVVDDTISMRFSHTLANRIYKEKRTYFQELEKLVAEVDSIGSVEALVASPIFGVDDNVAGVLYGARAKVTHRRLGITPLEAQVVKLLASAVGANLARSTALRTRVQFEQFFSAELVNQLQQDPKLLEPRNQEVTILCSDLRGFTTLSMRLGAETTCRLIQDLMERLTEHIVEEGGVIVDYAGDGILAMWNAPVPQPDHAQRACRAALRMKSELPGLNERWGEVVGAPLQLGIGLNTGDAQVGNIGSKRKFKYGPHGHTVNLASRVQDATKQFDSYILMTDRTYQLVADSFETQSVGNADLLGVAGSISLYELQGLSPVPEKAQIEE